MRKLLNINYIFILKPTISAIWKLLIKAQQEHMKSKAADCVYPAFSSPSERSLTSWQMYRSALSHVTCCTRWRGVIERWSLRLHHTYPYSSRILPYPLTIRKRTKAEKQEKCRHLLRNDRHWSRWLHLSIPPRQPAKRVTGGKRLHYEGSALEEPPHYNTANVNGN